MLLPMLMWLCACPVGAEEFLVPEGLVVTTWAESPDLFNPTALDVDGEGRVWVTEAVNYRKWDGRNPGREHPGGDRVVVLEDSDGDGRCDRSRVFVQDPELTSPLGIAVLGDRVLVSCSPNLFVYRDTDGDLVADEREVLLTGFGGFDHDHGLHSVVGGPDGRLYLAVGNAGPHVVTDRSGWTLRSGSLYRGGGPRTADNKPGLVSDDGRLWTGGLVLALEPDGTGLEVLAHNFRNNYEVAVDALGDLFQTDNDDDGNQGCRTLWCMPGGNHGFFSADGSRTWQADRRPGQSTAAAHWHQDDPGVVPAGSIHGAGGPTGLVVYEGELLAPWIGGAVVDCDAGAGVVYAHRPRGEGSGIALERTELLRGSGGGERPWFRPSDVVVGLDGALYVADWFDPGVGGHLAGDREAHGRILRLAPQGAPTEAQRPDLTTLAGRVAALDSPVAGLRYRAAMELRSAGEAAREPLRERWSRGGVEGRVRALWILVGDLGCEETLEEALASADPRLRVAALRAWRRHGEPAPEPLARLARDPSPAVRREVALSLRGRDFETSLPVLLALAEQLEPGDRYGLEAFGLAAEGHEEALFAELAAVLGDVPARWSPAFRELAWRLHPASAVPAWTARALEPRLDADARRQAIDALAFTPGRAAAEAVLTVAQAGPADLRAHAAWWVRHRDTNDWRAHGLARQLQDGDLSAAEVLFESEVLRDGSVAVDVDLTGATTLWLEVQDGGDGNGCDWADWLEPVLTVEGEERALTGIAWSEAESGWGSVNVDRNCGGGELAVGQERGLTGIGTHAPSRIAWPLPQGTTRLRLRAGVDRGGTDQGCGNSVRFRVLAQRPEPEGPDPNLARAERMLDPATPREERLELAGELARDPRGALRLLRLAAEQRLDEDLRPTVAAAIYQNPDVGVRALASEHFPAPGLEALPPVAELLALEGDVDRGRRVFLDAARSQCVTCHAFTLGERTLGGDIGPDLSRIREKYGRAEVLDAILHPSAGIAFGYDTELVETTDGELFSGFVLADGRDLVLKDTRGERWVLPADEIASRTRQTRSTMPEGVALGLEPGELMDLVDFLLDDPARREPVFGEELVLFDGTSLEGWTHHLSDPELDLEDVWRIEEGELVCSGRPAGYLRTTREFTSFLLTLEWRFDPARGPGNSGVLLRRTGEDKVWPRSIEAQLQHRSAGDIWNIDRFPMQTAPERTSGRHTARAQPSSERPVGEWNRYEILLDGPRLELRVNGVLQNTADWCEVVPGHLCLQSEGAEIRFRDIRLRPILR